MRLGFNITPLKNNNKYRGVGYYTQNLLKNLKSFPNIEIQEFDNLSEIKNADIIHYPFFDLFDYSLPLLKKFPTVVTIHDTTPLVFPNNYPVGLTGYLMNKIQLLSLMNISGIITDSESSRKDIHKYLHMSLEKIYPINLAVTDDFKIIKDRKKLINTKNKYKLPNKYALYIGNVNWNKNLINLTKACINEGLSVVFTGKDFSEKKDLNHKELESYKLFLEKFSNHDKVLVLGYVSTEDLVTIINLATLTLLPSFYEGFGIPILQSQACGTPIITSNISSMPEVAGEGAIFVDPYDVEDIVRGIERLQVTNYRLQLINKGFENLKRFSWQKTSNETIKVYQKILND